MPKILYYGPGALESNVHTINQFLEIVHREYANKNWSEDPIFKIVGRNHPQLNFKDWKLPEDFHFFTLVDWIEYTNAIVI